MQEVMIERACALLADGTVSRVLGWKTVSLHTILHRLYLILQKHCKRRLYIMISVPAICQSI